MEIAVLGAGFMGGGIAQVCAGAGHRVRLWDRTQALTERGLEAIAKSLDKRVAKGKETRARAEEVLGRVTPVDDLERAARGTDWIVEVILEDRDIKKGLLSEAERCCGEGTLISSNTSSIPITQLAEALQKPERFLGTHFFSPVPAMRLVEIIRGERTAPEAAERAREIISGIGKTGVLVKDSPGFLVNRINYALRMEAYRCLEEGIASVEDIDTALKLGLNHPMGPFELNDMTGLDVGLAGLETLYRATGEERWRPTGRVRRLVEAGELGRKSGKGWYDYTNGEKKARRDLA